jgi:hypothetical protein
MRIELSETLRWELLYLAEINFDPSTTYLTTSGQYVLVGNTWTRVVKKRLG